MLVLMSIGYHDWNGDEIPMLSHHNLLHPLHMGFPSIQVMHSVYSLAMVATTSVEHSSLGALHVPS